MNQHSFIEIKKLILTPLFAWTHPSDWGQKFINNQLRITVIGYPKSGGHFSGPFVLGHYLRSDSFHPVLTLHHPIQILEDIIMRDYPDKSEYPIRIEVVLSSFVNVIDFDITFVYDER